MKTRVIERPWKKQHYGRFQVQQRRWGFWKDIDGYDTAEPAIAHAKELLQERVIWQQSNGEGGR